MAICSFDQSRKAECYCACNFPMPAICSSCVDSHLNKSGSHFLLPLKAAIINTQSTQGEAWKTYLFKLRNAQDRLGDNLAAFDRCSKEIDAVYHELQQQLESLYTKLKKDLQRLRVAFEISCNLAVLNTTLQATEATFRPSDPMEQIILTGIMSPNSLQVFEYSIAPSVEHLESAFQVSYGVTVPGFSRLNQSDKMDRVSQMLPHVNSYSVRFFDFDMLQWRDPIYLAHQIECRFGTSYVLINDLRILSCGSTGYSGRFRSAYIVSENSVETLAPMLYNRYYAGLVYCPARKCVYVFGSCTI